jgi:hypothetical protein
MTDAPREPSFRTRREQTVAELLQADWEVVEEPGQETLPEPLHDFRPDILARRGSELLIVEIKSRRSSDLGRLDALATAVARVPDAKLEIDWLGDVPEFDPPAENIRAYLNNASGLIDSGAFTAAVLVAWAALEGAVVYFASDKDDVQPWNTPWQLLSDLYSLGYVSDGDFERLTAFWKLRNEIAHHVSPVIPGPEDVQTILQIAERMIGGRYVSTDQMIEWFLERYEDPAERTPYDSREGGYQYAGNGPHNARETLANNFPDATEADIDDAARTLERTATEWVEKPRRDT